MEKQPASMNKGWTSEEDQLLIGLIKRNSDSATISSVLGRTRAAILNRKFVLGIEGRIKRSPNGINKVSPLSYRKKGGNVIYKKLEPTKPTPKVGKKEKTSPPTKGEKTQVYKAIYISKNIIRGDISEIAKQLGVSVGHVSAVLNGAYENKTILDLAYTFLLERKGM